MPFTYPAKEINRLFGIIYAYEEATDAEEKLADWLGVSVKIVVELGCSVGCIAILLVDGQELCRMHGADPVSAVDELIRWAWGTLVIATGTCVWDRDEVAEA